MKTELAVYEGKLCPEALGQQSIKLSQQNWETFKIPLLNNGCQTLCILHDVLQKRLQQWD